MRNFLVGFLTLIMFTPSLVCTMDYCPMPVKSEQKPCHQTSGSQKDGPMLALDCMGVNLFQQEVQIDVPQPDRSVNIIHFAWADIAADYSFQPTKIHDIRGPPDETGQIPDAPPLILITQRFRI
ncbi:MAG: hypothetical protein KDJ75_08940 [Alphaproteobacteria bacterium]|nr:hypothetical protein [Alphaproteobacteria bacterium]